MKAVDLNKNNFWYNNGVVSSLDMSSGNHIHFTAVDKNYELSVEAPGGKKSKLPVPNDGTYHAYEIQGVKGVTYKFTIDQPTETVPQMIVRVN
ncbi:MAG: hypothetical protein A2V93_12790 [Ignavibacteria bacterium RBG_16_34_14]|nr:MAG: hypothetical protein A2V93_12790 [Ignavibacteria bacterium RBG_16_34_14]